ncbi:hypothetical protein BOX15_Mlig021430g1 [Macrostomum lignano]|uniref:Cytochrome P450 n=1 Tax=Macrostomum lignano TaxID=282301 RepID=A0A267G484_9PLAT|nr:hypothetical protein BOX15_Mlig021430g1 [Macrostomum lignano]
MLTTKSSASFYRFKKQAMQIILSRISTSALPLHVPRWMVCAALGAAVVYIYGSWPYRYWKKRGVKGPTMVPILGDMLRFVKFGGFRQMMLADLQEFGRVYGTYFMRRPVLVVADPDMLKQICIKRSENFTDRGTLGNETYPMDKGILTLKGQEWKRVRSLMTPAFSSGKMKVMFPLVEQSARQLCDSLLKAEGSVVDVKAYFTNFTMDAVACTLFGLQINTQENPENEFNRNGSEIFNFDFRNWKIWLLFLLPGISVPLFKRFGISLFKQANLNFFQDVISRALVEREASVNCDEYRDFLAAMVTARREAEQQGAKGLSEHEVLAQSLTLFLAGFETTSSALQFMAFFLAWNTDCQDRAYKEVAEAKAQNRGSITYKCLQGLTFLNQCLDETLRLCPPALFTDRVCTETTVINGYEVEKGVNVRIPIVSIAHDPEAWENPEVFNPDRFARGSTDGAGLAHFLPFGMGPRSCIGMRLAQMEIRKAMAELLLAVEFRTAPDTKPYEQLDYKATTISAVKEPIKLRILSRKA